MVILSMADRGSRLGRRRSCSPRLPTCARSAMAHNAQIGRHQASSDRLERGRAGADERRREQGYAMRPRECPGACGGADSRLRRSR